MDLKKLLDRSCVTCGHFAWWDGDYCCIKKRKIFQEGTSGDMSQEIIMPLRLNLDCEEYNHTDNTEYKEILGKLLNKLS